MRQQEAFDTPRPLISAAILLCITAGALIAPIVLPGDPARIDLSIGPSPISTAHPFGTDLLGRDVLRMSLYAARVSLVVGIASASLSALLGLALGATAAYAGGLADALVCRLVDAALAIPAFFVLVAIQAVLGPGVANVVVVISLVSWMATARVMRALVLSLRESDFVVAARGLGGSGARIVLVHILPALLRPAATLFALAAADALLMESALSFLGLGVPPTQPSWGNMLSSAEAGILSGVWWLAVFPGGLIVATALSINLLADSLRSPLARSF